MSDGITESYRDQREQERLRSYLLAVGAHLGVRTQDTLDTCFQYKDRLEAERQISKLLANDQQEWAKFSLACRESSELAYVRAKVHCPWTPDLSIRLISFDRWSKEGEFWEPLFKQHGFATNGSHGPTDGYDQYAILYSDSMSLKQIVAGAVWLGYHPTTFYSSDVDLPKSPWRKERL